MNTGRPSINPQPICEFSDFGSWYQVDENTIVYWDMVLKDDESHEESHQYQITWVEFTATESRIKRAITTKKKYDPGWGANGNRPLKIDELDDPLREVGLRWRWWG